VANRYKYLFCLTETDAYNVMVCFKARRINEVKQETEFISVSCVKCRIRNFRVNERGAEQKYISVVLYWARNRKFILLCRSCRGTEILILFWRSCCGTEILILLCRG
jgi:predicted nucleic-acid-binding Zn-ribbon protein